MYTVFDWYEDHITSTKTSDGCSINVFKNLGIFAEKSLEFYIDELFECRTLGDRNNVKHVLEAKLYFLNGINNYSNDSFGKYLFKYLDKIAKINVLNFIFTEESEELKYISLDDYKYLVREYATVINNKDPNFLSANRIHHSIILLRYLVDIEDFSKPFPVNDLFYRIAFTLGCDTFFSLMNIEKVDGAKTPEEAFINILKNRKEPIPADCEARVGYYLRYTSFDGKYNKFLGELCKTLFDLKNNLLRDPYNVLNKVFLSNDTDYVILDNIFKVNPELALHKLIEYYKGHSKALCTKTEYMRLFNLLYHNVPQKVIYTYYGCIDDIENMPRSKRDDENIINEVLTLIKLYNGDFDTIYKILTTEGGTNE